AGALGAGHLADLALAREARAALVVDGARHVEQAGDPADARVVIAVPAAGGRRGTAAVAVGEAIGARGQAVVAGAAHADVAAARREAQAAAAVALPVADPAEHRAHGLGAVPGRRIAVAAAAVRVGAALEAVVVADGRRAPLEHAGVGAALA